MLTYMLLTLVSALLYQLVSVSCAPSSHSPPQSHILPFLFSHHHQPLHDGRLSSYLNKPNEQNDAYNSWSSDSNYSAWEVSGARQGDILEDDLDIGFRKKRGTRLWPRGVVPYRIEHSHYDQKQLSKIRAAMEAIEGKTCIRFRPLRQGDTSWVEMDRRYTHGCFSYVGSLTGGQLLHLASECFQSGTDTIVHELLHALGLYHMQSAPYRNYYIDVHTENIQEHYVSQFRIEDQWIDYGVGYDFNSIMHYNPKAATRNGLDTMTPKIPGVRMQVNRELSAKDVLTLNIMYQCYQV